MYIIYVLIIFRQTWLFNNFSQQHNIIFCGNLENPINQRTKQWRYFIKILETEDYHKDMKGVEYWKYTAAVHWCQGEIIFSFAHWSIFWDADKIYSIFFQLSLFVTAGSSTVVPFPIQYLLNIPRCNWFLSVSQERLKSSGNMVWRIQSQTRGERKIKTQKYNTVLTRKEKFVPLFTVQSAVIVCLGVWLISN